MTNWRYSPLGNFFCSLAALFSFGAGLWFLLTGENVDRGLVLLVLSYILDQRPRR